jgi:hypothetical protein
MFRPTNTKPSPRRTKIAGKPQWDGRMGIAHPLEQMAAAPAPTPAVRRDRFALRPMCRDRASPREGSN